VCVAGTIKLTPQSERESHSQSAIHGFAFTAADISETDARVKHLSLLDYATGRLLLADAALGGEGTEDDERVSCLDGRPASAALLSPLPILEGGEAFPSSFLRPPSSFLASLRLRELAVSSFSSALRSDTFNLAAAKEKCLAK